MKRHTMCLMIALQFGLLLADQSPIVEKPAFIEKAVVIDKTVVNNLQSAIVSAQQKLIKDLPDSVRKDVLSVKNPMSIYDIPDRSQEWVHRNVSATTDAEITKCFDSLEIELKLSGDKMHADDYSSILEQAFFAKLHGKPFNIEERIEYYVVYWREHSKPSVRFSPNGQGEIDWLWELEVKERLHGVLHVGLDRKKRTFICYEHSVGLYFPEGAVMERIYSEIVQEPEVAGEFIGKGLLENGAIDKAQNSEESDPNNKHSIENRPPPTGE